MSKKFVYIFGMVLLLALAIVPGAMAQSATNATWSTSITYYAPSDSGGTLNIAYYAEGSSTPINASPITLDPHKAGSLYIGNVSGMSSTFSGSAVLSSDVPIVATGVNLAGSEYPRPLYSGFSPEKASNSFFVPTILYRKFDQSSLLSIQNVESSSVNATVKVYAKGAATPSFEDTYSIPAQSAKLIPAADMGLAAGFTGSATVDTGGGKIVAAVQETDDNGRGAKAFEGVASDAGATTIYMASMMCRAFSNQQISYYAIQNVGSSSASVEIDFYDKLGSLVYTTPSIDISQNNKESINPCQYVSNESALEGVVGSAVIRSTNSVPLVAVGKVNADNMTPTAFLGETSGSLNTAAAYIRWQADETAGERSYVAVMNVGSGDATNVKVTYYDNQGNPANTHTLADSSDPLGRFIKANTNAATANATDVNGNFGVNPYGGAIEVESDQPVVVVVRVSKVVGFGGVTKFAEDYNGVPVN